MPAQFQDYYATLGVARDATPEQLKKAFRKLARQFHPDTAADKKQAEEKFKAINEANEVLSDPVKRAKYDKLGEHWQDAGFQPPPSQQGQGSGGEEFHFGGTGFSDFFEQYFSGASAYGVPPPWHAEGEAHAPGKGRARRGHDIEGDILVTLEDAMHGTVRPISLQTVNRQTGQQHTDSFQVRIPPGAIDGRRIRVPGHGSPGSYGGEAGDLYLRVRHAAHPDFSTRDADLHHELDVAPWEAVLGAEIEVATLDGIIKVKLPPHTENGQTLRVRDRGLPKGKSGERGHFYVTVHVVLPRQTSDAERALWEQLRATTSFCPRATPAH